MHAQRFPAFLQQLPCSWGSLYFPQPWIEFHQYMQQRLHGALPVQIEGSVVNGWSESWKKFMMEQMHLHGYVVLYPNFYNQVAVCRGRVVSGEWVAGKSSFLCTACNVGRQGGG